MIIHAAITLDRVVEALERSDYNLDNPGFCVRCGADTDGVEPDARDCQCEACGENGVHGAEEMMLRLA